MSECNVMVKRVDESVYTVSAYIKLAQLRVDECTPVEEFLSTLRKVVGIAEEEYNSRDLYIHRIRGVDDGVVMDVVVINRVNISKEKFDRMYKGSNLLPHAGLSMSMLQH